jgi:hypothetical protein
VGTSGLLQLRKKSGLYSLWFLKTFRIWAKVSAWHWKVRIPRRFLVLPTIDSRPEADEATEDEVSGEEESRIYAARS